MQKKIRAFFVHSNRWAGGRYTPPDSVRAKLSIVRERYSYRYGVFGRRRPSPAPCPFLRVACYVVQYVWNARVCGLEIAPNSFFFSSTPPETEISFSFGTLFDCSFIHLPCRVAALGGQRHCL